MTDTPRWCAEATIDELARGFRENARVGALGHANIQMTMRYAHLAPEIARDSVQLLDRRSNFDGRGSVVAATP